MLRVRWCARPESNRRKATYEVAALPLDDTRLVNPVGFDPTTSDLKGQRSTGLSYGSMRSVARLIGGSSRDRTGVFPVTGGYLGH